MRKVPAELKEQFADGGRLLLSLSTETGQELQLITRTGGSFSTKVLGLRGFSALTGKYGAETAPKRVRRLVLLHEYVNNYLG